MEKENHDLQKLSRFDLWLVVMYWRLLLVKRKYLNQSLPLRLVPVHTVLMLGILLAFPHTYPPNVIVPIIVVAAYYFTLLILFMLPSSYKSKIKKVEHWVQ